MPVNTPQQWSVMSRALHWIGAALVLFLLAHGWWMVHMLQPGTRLEQYRMHTSVGYFLLALVIGRMMWRWASAAPAYPAGVPAWERTLAQAIHVVLYLVLLLESYLGWALAGTLRHPADTTLFGTVRVPPLANAPGHRELRMSLDDVHAAVAYLLVALIAIHVATAVYHWRLRRFEMLQRMQPG